MPTNTIGMVLVACRKAVTVGEAMATITSGGSPAISVA
jgi:hypothetical protein